MRYIYHNGESKDDVRYDYYWELLRTALELTNEGFPEFVMTPTNIFINEVRQFQLLQKGDELTVMFQPANIKFDKTFYSAKVPLAKGLTGYRVFLINREDQNLFSNVYSLKQLQSYSVGTGKGWSDIGVWEYNKFKVIEGTTYEGLFPMTVARRFGFFSRSILEVIDEYKDRKDKYTNLSIESSLLVHYNWPIFFYFPKTEKGKLLAQRAEEGLKLIFSDDELFNSIFNKYYPEVFEYLHISQRRLIELENPYISPNTPFNTKEYWIDPLTTPDF